MVLTWLRLDKPGLKLDRDIFLNKLDYFGNKQVES